MIIFKRKIFLFFLIPIFLCAKTSYFLSIWDNVDKNKELELQYIDKNAPKGEMIRFGVVGTFDNFNPFAKRGIAGAFMTLTYETIGKQSVDYSFISKSLVAESFEVADDYSYLIVNINKDAKFQDNSHVNASDIKYSFEALIKEATPKYKSYYNHIQGVEILSPLRVKFIFNQTDNKELPLIVTQIPVISHKWGMGKNLGEPQNMPFLGSGPYKLKDYKIGSYIIYERDKNWWGEELEINKGFYNFDTIRIDYYRDQTVMREAFFAGEIDFYAETTIKDWINSYDIPPVKEKKITKEEVDIKKSSGMRGFFFNTRKGVFSDIHVRQALSLLFDFEWTNKALFYDKYSRYESFFSNSDFVAPKYPSQKELEILELYKDRLSKEVFGAIPDVPKTDGSGNIREQLIKALSILKKSDWRLEKGKLLNSKNEQMKISIPLNNKTFMRVLMPFKKNLEQIGIIVDIEMVDQTQYINRVRSFDYDMIMAYVPQSNSPGNEQRYYWKSDVANTNGTSNYAGIRDEVVDSLVERLIVSKTYDELIVNTQVLDRVLRHGYYVIPGWYSKKSFISWWNEKITPPHSHPKSGIDINSWYSTKLKKD